MRTIVVSLAVLWLSGCAIGSSVMQSESVSYDDVIEQTTNRLLLANVLRARDKAPLHFADFTKVNETITQTASLSAVGGDTHTVTPGYTLAMSPYFELAHIYDQKFITGIASEIDHKFVKYWLDRGLDSRVVLLVFFRSITATKDSKSIKIANSPRLALRNLQGTDSVAANCPTTDFARYLAFINTLKGFGATESKDSKTIAAAVPPKGLADLLKALKEAGAGKLSVKCDARGEACNIQESEVSLTYIASKPRTGNPRRAEGVSEPVIKRTLKEPPPGAVRISYDDDPQAYCTLFASMLNPSSEIDLEFNTRSVGEIIQFLGDVVALEEGSDRCSAKPAMAGQQSVTCAINNPITLGYCADRSEDGCDDVLFQATSDESRPRFEMKYRGSSYSIAQFTSPERKNGMGGLKRDHSIEILAVVSQLIGLQREQKEFQSTPSVRVIP